MNRELFKEQLQSVSTTLLSSAVATCVGRAITAKSKGLDNPTRLKVIACQECSEFIKEITDDIRGKGDINGILEEMADVLISIWTLQEIYDISDELLNQAVNVKVDEYANKISKNKGLV